MEPRKLDQLDLLIHKIVGGWMLEYKVLARPGALDAIEDRLRAAFLAYGDARADGDESAPMTALRAVLEKE